MTAGSVAVPTIMPLRAPIPGQHKNIIDSNTKVELRSETQGASIYYTVNGSKPEPFQTIGPAAKSTLKYKEPFRIPSGRRTVKAVAIGPDGIRESHIVSKTFDVQKVESDYVNQDEDGMGFMQDIPQTVKAKKDVDKFAHKMVTSKEAWAEIQALKKNSKNLTLNGSNRHRPSAGARYTDSRLGGSAPRSASDMEIILSESSKFRPPDTATQAMRLQRETDFLKCIHCFADRPSDPYARFCYECGNPVPPLPQTRIAPPEPGQMGTCVHCKSVVPFNTPNCLICEAPMAPQNQPMASVRLQPKVICSHCFTSNPANISHCVTCETKLGLEAKSIITSAPHPKSVQSGGRKMTCSKCGRVNDPEARFCDWCGAKPCLITTPTTCSKCHAANQPYAQFCASCGTTIYPPLRTDLINNGISYPLDPDRLSKSSAQWLPLSLSGHPVPTQSVQTQTVGLFFPSQKQITRKEIEEEEKMAMDRMMRDRKPLITAISPGKGYWRKQMEHICTHLKTHAQNNAEFRSLIGEPRMGKILSTAVHEDGYELSLNVNFALRGNKDPFIGDKMGTNRDLLSSYTEGRKSSLNRYPSQESLVTGRSTINKKSAKSSKKKSAEENLKLEDKKLLKEVGKNGDGSVTEIQQLIDEGADVNVTNKDGYSSLHLAVINKHIDAIPVLVQEGADVNKKGNNKGNTALHEAVAHGTGGLDIIDALLRCNANPQKKNDKGETAYDLAVKDGYETLANKLASNLGQSALDKLIKPKSSTNEIF